MLRTISLPTLCLACALLLPGCPGGDPDDTAISPYEVAGSYDSTSAWDLSSPLTGDGVAGLVADLVVDQIVQLAGVPDALQDEARERVAQVVYQPVHDQVRAALPAELLPESGLMGDMAAILSSVTVRSTLDLQPGFDNPNLLSGSDTITAVSVSFSGQTLSVAIPELLANTGAVSIAGSLDGQVATATRFVIEPYDLEIHLGNLVTMAATELLAIADVAALSQQAADAIDCVNIIDSITGGANTFDISVSGEVFSVGVDMLTSGCQAARQQIGGQVLGLFNVDTGVRLGGGVTMNDDDGDVIVDRLTSGADYGGWLTSLPLPIPVPFAASFSASTQ